MPKSILKRLLTLVLPLFCILSMQSQTIDWPQHADSIYVFEINNKEAEKLLKGKIKDNQIDKILRTPVDAYPYAEVWKHNRAQGHFIHAKIDKNKVQYSYESVIPFQVFLFSEYGTLTMQVVDIKGEIRSDAKVNIKGKWRLFDTGITFDKETQTYRIDDWSTKTERILTVELDKFKAVFDLSKKLVNPWYGSSGGGGNSREFYSYMITDKNKYKPKEKVRFKSYALTGSRSPIKKPLEVWLQEPSTNYSYKHKKIMDIAPYNPGGFAGEIELHDSLKLLLDKSYNMQLREKKGRIVSTVNFKYEDYELYDTKLEVKVKNDNHYAPNDNQVELKVVDANGLTMLDAKANVLVQRLNVDRSFAPIVSLPDTLMYKQVTLNNDGFTTVDIPSNLFTNANGRYNIRIEALMHDGQKLNYTRTIYFYSSSYQVVEDTRNDTIHFRFMELGEEKRVKATLKYHGSETTKAIELPYEEPFVQSLAGYTIKVADPAFETTIRTSEIESKLALKGGFAKDTFNVKLANPLQLDVTWYVYRGNLLLEKGSGKECDVKIADTDLGMAHYVEVFYFMGEKEHIFRQVFVPKTEYLDVDLDIPARIYPGQSFDATISVKDNWGRGVKGVDLTAFAVNSQLDYQLGDLPYYGKAPETREQRSSYAIKKRKYGYETPLDWNRWNKLVNLQRQEYYRFTYPHIRTFTHISDTPDSITQFAPYVMNKGYSMDIIAITANGKPLYFNWTKQPKQYSFEVPHDKKQRIMLRMHDRAIFLDSIQFEKGKKTILSIDLEHTTLSAKVIHFKPNSYNAYSLTNEERGQYLKYIAYFPTYNLAKTDLKQGDKTYPIYRSVLQSRNAFVLAGPIPQGESQYTSGPKYEHEGGFKYDYKGNVVYKYGYYLFPEYISSEIKNIDNLNDRVMTKDRLAQMVFDATYKSSTWFPENVYISLVNMALNVDLPAHRDSSGVAKLLLRDSNTKEILSFAKLENDRSHNSRMTVPPGMYNLICLYRNGKYWEHENIPFNRYTYTAVKVENTTMQRADSASLSWLNTSNSSIIMAPQTKLGTTRSTYYTRTSSNRNPSNTISGIVQDSEGEPLIGVSIALEGTTHGTLTDVNGRFYIETDSHNSTLKFMYIGYKEKVIDVTQGSDIIVVMGEDQLLLEEVVVVGYGSVRKMHITGSISSVSSSSFENSLSAPPERLDDVADDGDDDNDRKDEAEERLYSELAQLNGLRSNFSDVGFWQPALYTNREGKAEFSITFPDNITQWNALVYAMNRKLKTGTLRKNIKSFKPIMAELRSPQFLVVGDSSYFSANIRNYTKDTNITGRVVYSIRQDTVMNKPIQFASSHQDKMLVSPSDTCALTTTYMFTRDDGYNDGEQRTITVEQQGVEIAEGTLSILKNGDKISAQAGNDEELHISLATNQIDVYVDTYNYLTGYKYDCNEQLASKLVGLLNSKMHTEYMGQKFGHDKNVNDIIKRLIGNRNKERLWSWWGTTFNPSHWMSAHIIRALKMANDAGYKVDMDIKAMQYDYIDTKQFRRQSLSDIEVLHALSEWDVKQSYGSVIDQFEQQIKREEHVQDSLQRVHAYSNIYRRSYLKEKLLLLEMRQKHNIGYRTDSISKYLKKDILGGIYCDDGNKRDWYSDKLLTTLIAYRIIRNDSTLQDLKIPMQTYILSTKSNGWNTYQASSAISTVFADLLADGHRSDKPSSVMLSGKENKEVSKYPYHIKLAPNEHLDIEQKGSVPLIYSAYNIKRKTEANSGEAFDVFTYFNAGIKQLTAGQPATLTVRVDVKQENAQHVMIEVPIPAGCSYASKRNYYYSGKEVHREHFKEKTVIFCEKLDIGTHTFEIQLLPRYTGTYIINPAKVEMMYFPVINANNDMRKVEILE